MPKLPILSAKKVIKILCHLGFFVDRQKGSHVILKKKKTNGFIGCVVPMHKELAVGTLQSILRQAEIEPKHFITASKKRMI